MPTFASVTETPCTCGYLQGSAADPDHPIEFDDTLNEFHFVVHGTDGAIKNTLCLYHCPFCGGVAPPSKREALFAEISDAEVARIKSLFAGLQTLEDVRNALGPPDSDDPEGFIEHHPERDGRPPQEHIRRSLRYCDLSNSVDVSVHENGIGGLAFTFSGKRMR